MIGIIIVIILSGVTQSSVLGPFFFLCYINDLPAEVEFSIKLYPDDALVYCIIHLKLTKINYKKTYIN